MRTLTSWVALILLTPAGIGLAGEWASVRGRILYDGPAPIPAKVHVDKDVEVCGKYDLVDESLIVNRSNRGIRDVVIMLKLGRRESVDIHPSYEPEATATVLLQNKCCRFDPHVMMMRTSQKLKIHNSDPKGDTVRIDAIKNSAINVTLPPGTDHLQEFPNVETLPVRVTCGIHSWELGWLVITDHPYVTVTDGDGYFEIRNLPAGKLSLMFWHEKSSYVDEVVWQGTSQSWRRGTKELMLNVGDNDLGNIIVSPSLFEK